VVDYEFYCEDSIYYTSAAKDTVIGCHPQLHNTTLPESVTAIAKNAFSRLDNLSSISLPDGLKYIGRYAFYLDGKLKEVTIPQSVKTIEEYAFRSCYGLTTVNFNAENCTKMGYNINPITGTVTGNDVFSWCDSITTINIGEDVKRIPDYAFNGGCYNLKGTLVIPNKVTYIGSYAFAGFWGGYRETYDDTLRIYLGSKVVEIGNYAFSMYYDKLRAVVATNPIPPTIYAYSFYLVPDTATLTVPCGSVEAYRAADYWNEFVLINEDCGGGTEGIEDIMRNASERCTARIYTQNGRIVVEGADDEIRVFDMTGRLVATSKQNIVKVAASGVYLVKVGDCPAQKVTVMR
jgi:hypothetical protein